MRWSQYFLYTTREVPKDAEVASHRLMLRAGMIRKLAAGIYTYLPFGWRSLRKLEAIVRRELERAGSVELSMPAIQPGELWEASGRWQAYGPELLRLNDRHGRAFCFGPTHEEVITDAVAASVKSYRQLPVNLYQIQVKFRDEIRPRFGLMRGREFLMKDAYSFHVDEPSLDEVYVAMRDAYERIFRTCHLDFQPVDAATGSIGGSSSHEFMVLAETGEDAIATCAGCGYAANVELAVSGELEPPAGGGEEELREVATPGTTTVPEVAKLLDVEPARVVKTLLYESDAGTVAAVVRGDRDLNEAKLTQYLGADYVELASEEVVESATGSAVGFAGPVGLADGVRLVADRSTRALEGFVAGANSTDAHLVGVSWGRDATPDEWADLTEVAAGDPCPRCDGTLEIVRGIEVGHVFKLGTKYSEPMGCLYTDAEGIGRPMVMGCYGLGIGRTVAAAIEQNHDDRGIVWPRPLAPFEVLVVSLDPDDPEVAGAADGLYDRLREAGADVFYDDRAERPGVKFNDADLIGVPVRLVVGKRSLAGGEVELSHRRDREKQKVAVADAAARALELLDS